MNDQPTSRTGRLGSCSSPEQPGIRVSQASPLRRGRATMFILTGKAPVRLAWRRLASMIGRYRERQRR
jgi:hypothetical protein